MRMTPTFDFSSLMNTMSPSTGAMAPPMPSGGGSSLLQSIQDEATQKAIKQREEKSAKLMEQAQKLQAESAQLKAPAPTPALRSPRDLILPGIVALIGKLLFHAKDQDIAAGGNAFIGARQDLANRQDQFNQQDFANRRQGLLSGAQSALQGSQFEQDAADRLYSRDQDAQRRADTIEAKRIAARDKAEADVQNRYYSANTPGEKRSAAAAWRAMNPATAPKPEDVDQEARFLLDRQVSSARTDFQNRVKGRLNFFGLIDDRDLAELSAERDSVAKAYGVDPSIIGDIPTGETLQKQKAAQLKTQFDQTFAFKDKVWREEAANRAARLEISKQHLELARQGFGLNTRKFEYAVEKDARALSGMAGKDLAKASAELQKEQAILAVVQKRYGKAIPGLQLVDIPEVEKQKQKVQAAQDKLDALQSLAGQADEALAGLGTPETAGAPNAPFNPVGGGTAIQPEKSPALAGPIGGGSRQVVRRPAKRPAKAPAKSSARAGKTKAGNKWEVVG